MEVKIGDRVKLPFDETGTVVKHLNLLWGFSYVVRIRKGTFNITNQRLEFKKEQLQLE